MMRLCADFPAQRRNHTWVGGIPKSKGKKSLQSKAQHATFSLMMIWGEGPLWAGLLDPLEKER